MNVAYKGFFDENNKYPYVLIDTGDIATETQAGLDIFNDMNIGTAVSNTSDSNSATNSSATFLHSVVSPWKGVSGLNDVTKIQSINRFGFAVSAGESAYNAYSVASLADDGGITRNGSIYIHKASVGTLVVSTNPLGAAGNLTVRRTIVYSSGAVRLIVSYSSYNEVCIQSMPDGSIFFFTSSPSITPVIGSISDNNALFNTLGFLEPKRIYCIRAATALAQGYIYNASGGVAPNCSVMAFNRVTGRNVGKTKSKPDGSYSLLAIASKGDELFIVCLDDDGVAPEFEAQIIDRVLV